MKEEKIIPDYAIWFKQTLDALGINANELSQKTGESNLKYYNVLNGKNRPGHDTIRQILELYPRLNVNFLINGQPPILHTSGAVIVGTFNTIDLPVRLTGIDAMPTENSPVIAKNRDLKDCFVVRLTDNSMRPTHPAGTEFLSRPIPQQEWPYVNSKLCVVLYRHTFVVRQIRENDLKKHGHLTLYATSPDAGYVQIDADDLRGIYEILEIVGGGVS